MTFDYASLNYEEIEKYIKLLQNLANSVEEDVNGVKMAKRVMSTKFALERVREFEKEIANECRN